MAVKVNSAGEAVLHNWIDNADWMREQLALNEEGNAEHRRLNAPIHVPTSKDLGAFIFIDRPKKEGSK
jgi:hypothetical protein